MIDDNKNDCRWQMMPYWAAILNYQFQNSGLLFEAIGHPRVTNTSKTFERLEFLGDRVLSLVISDVIYRSGDSAASEHNMALLLAKYTSTDGIVNIINIYQLSRYIYVTKANDMTNIQLMAKYRSCIVDVVEAVLGALYLDAGYSIVQNTIQNLWHPVLKGIDNTSINIVDPKTRLQEYAQQHHHQLPLYTVINSIGVDHAPIFTINVVIPNTSIMSSGTGTGNSKKIAEQKAALDLLKKIEK